MEIISHSGYWYKNTEKNSDLAFRRSFSLNFGTETDVRDFDGKLVISHDVANKNCITIEKFFEIYKSKWRAKQFIQGKFDYYYAKSLTQYFYLIHR